MTDYRSAPKSTLMQIAFALCALMCQSIDASAAGNTIFIRFDGTIDACAGGPGSNCNTLLNGSETANRSFYIIQEIDGDAPIYAPDPGSFYYVPGPSNASLTINVAGQFLVDNYAQNGAGWRLVPTSYVQSHAQRAYFSNEHYIYIDASLGALSSTPFLRVCNPGNIGCDRVSSVLSAQGVFAAAGTGNSAVITFTDTVRQTVIQSYLANATINSITVGAPVPEPRTLYLLSGGLFALILKIMRRGNFAFGRCSFSSRRMARNAA